MVKVSVLMPSRARIDMARKSIESLGSGDFEVLVYVDDDDPDRDSYSNIHPLTGPPVGVLTGPRVGYYNFHKMINLLAGVSTGDYLMLWNDDALMETEDWVSVIEEQAKPMRVLNFYDPANKLNNLFPLIPREVYEAMGHFSLSTHCDSWVQDLANELNIHQPIYGIKARHIRDIVNDETKADSQKAYATTSPLYSSDEMQKLWREDVEKVKEYI